MEVQYTRRRALALGAIHSLNAHNCLSKSIERRVGIGYSLWHRTANWVEEQQSHCPWGKPVLGYYRSDDLGVLRQHAAWLAGANVDYAVIDWSNDIDTDIRVGQGPPDQMFIEYSTNVLLETWAKLSSRPKIAFLLGVSADDLRREIASQGSDADLNALSRGRLGRKADQVYDLCVKPHYASLMEAEHDRPLLIVYIAGQTPFRTTTPLWHEPRFTVRYLSAYLPESGLADPPDRISRAGYWSWEDRGPPSYTIRDGRPEHMTVVASWRPRPGVAGGDRLNGSTFRAGWERACSIRPVRVLAGTFNEWWIGEQPSPENSKDIEPSEQFGTLYLDILRAQAARFKSL